MDGSRSGCSCVQVITQKGFSIMFKSRTVIAGLAVMAAASGVSSLIPASANAAVDAFRPSSAAIGASFGESAHDIAGLRGILTSSERGSLTRQLLNARTAFGRGRSCTALTMSGRVRGGLEKYMRKAGGDPGFVAADSALVNLQVGLLTSADTHACGGGQATGGASAQVRVLKSTPEQLVLHVMLPQPRLFAHTYQGHTFPDLEMQGMASSARPGSPDVPQLGRMFAIPQGATASVHVGQAHSILLPAIHLFPAQSQSADMDTSLVQTPFSQPLFMYDHEAYARTTPFPAATSQVRKAGRMRDLNVGSLDLAGAQFTGGVRPSVRVFTSYDVTVDFRGGDGTFTDKRATSAWNDGFEQVYNASLLNANAASRYVSGVGNWRFCGEEVLIVTPPALLDAANTLADARRAHGMSVTVVQTGTGQGQIGTTPSQIQSYIRSQVNSTACWIRPSYVVLMGDTAQLPTFHPASPWASGTGFDGTIASDQPYSLADDSDLLADVAVGRIPAPDLATANTVVGKIVAYEDSPPVNSAFYSHAMGASYFQAYADDGNTSGPASTQDTRTFIRTAETVRSALTADGKTVDRIYDTEGTSPAPNPLTYDDGTNLPAALKRPTFAWNGNAADITAGWNAGRFMIFHRDHGWPGGWGNPGFSTGNIPSLHNGNLLPVVFSVNCASGQFDTPGSPSFVEQIVQKADGGAVGAVGDSRNSPSTTNSEMALGMMDAMFPNVLPGSGSATPITRMGLVVDAGKAYVNSVEGAGSSTNQAEQYLYHWFGDPTMPIWRANPHRFVIGDITITQLEKQLMVTVKQPGLRGALVTLLDGNGNAIGRARLEGSQLLMTPEDTRYTAADVARVSFQADGYVPVTLNAHQLQIA
jgi:hypothetical protein